MDAAERVKRNTTYGSLLSINNRLLDDTIDTLYSLVAENERLREALNGFMNAEKTVLSDDNGTLFKVVTLTQDCWAKGYAALQPKENK